MAPISKGEIDNLRHIALWAKGHYSESLEEIIGEIYKIPEDSVDDIQKFIVLMKTCKVLEISAYEVIRSIASFGYTDMMYKYDNLDEMAENIVNKDSFISSMLDIKNDIMLDKLKSAIQTTKVVEFTDGDETKELIELGQPDLFGVEVE